jgi:hypothetical protein
MMRRDRLTCGILSPPTLHASFRVAASSAPQTTQMTHRIIVLIVFLLVSRCIDARMLRVVSVEDGQTIVVERNGAEIAVRLAGIVIDDAVGARSLLEWSLADAWVLLEEQPGGAQLVWRTPDGMFINRELVLRGYAHATLPAVQPPAPVVGTYLGVVDPAGTQRLRAPGRGTRSGKSPRPKAPPKPKRRSRR